MHCSEYPEVSQGDVCYHHIMQHSEIRQTKKVAL